MKICRVGIRNRSAINQSWTSKSWCAVFMSSFIFFWFFTEDFSSSCLVSSSISKTSQDTIMANSPSLDMGLLMSDYPYSDDFTCYQPYSSVHRSLSNAVAPVDVTDESWLDSFNFDFDCNQYLLTTDLSTSPTKSFDDDFITSLLGDGLEDLLNEFPTGNACCEVQWKRKDTHNIALNRFLFSKNQLFSNFISFSLHLLPKLISLSYVCLCAVRS